jgi:hypothetical protein
LITGTHTITCIATGTDGQTLQKTIQVLISQVKKVGLLSGIILNGNSSPIQNANINIANKSTTSLTNGSYSIGSIIYGTYNLLISKIGYISYSQQITINQNNNLKNITLKRVEEPTPIQAVKVPCSELGCQPESTQTGILEGKIKDKFTNQSLLGANISIDNKTAISNTNGSYYLSDISYGEHTLIVSLSGYETYTQTITINKESDILDIKIIKPTSTLKGKVTSNNQEISNVSISLGNKIVSTDNNGDYIIENITTFSTRRINASKDGYENYQGEISFTKGIATIHNINLIALPDTTNPINVNDKTTTIGNLMWQDESYTSEEENAYGTDTNIGKVGNWEYAKRYCSNLSLAGYSDWYLPNKDQLENLYTQKDKLTNITSSIYWSSSSYASNSSYAWYVYFYYGYANYRGKTNSHYVRCVRGKQ